MFMNKFTNRAGVKSLYYERQLKANTHVNTCYRMFNKCDQGNKILFYLKICNLERYLN